jgi:hypothetical protein
MSRLRQRRYHTTNCCRSAHQSCRPACSSSTTVAPEIGSSSSHLDWQRGGLGQRRRHCWRQCRWRQHRFVVVAPIFTGPPREPRGRVSSTWQMARICRMCQCWQRRPGHARARRPLVSSELRQVQAADAAVMSQEEQYHIYVSVHAYASALARGPREEVSSEVMVRYLPTSLCSSTSPRADRTCGRRAGRVRTHVGWFKQDAADKVVGAASTLSGRSL